MVCPKDCKSFMRKHTVGSIPIFHIMSILPENITVEIGNNLKSFMDKLLIFIIVLISILLIGSLILIGSGIDQYFDWQEQKISQSE